MSAVDLRPATWEDAERIAAIERCSTPQPWSASTLETTLRDRVTRAWVACHGDEIVGHILTNSVAGTAEIMLVAVDPPWRRRGIARILMAKAEAQWRADGVADAWLEVRLDNLAALPMYRSLGWRDAGRRRKYYPDGTDALLLRLDLAEAK